MTGASVDRPGVDLVVQHPALADAAVAAFAQRIGRGPGRRESTLARWPDTTLTLDEVRALGDTAGVDANLVDPGRRLADFGLLAFDMDSTLITVECIDELAHYAGRKAEVAAITEAAMRGEIVDYTESLRRRLAILEGLPATVLEQVYAERVRISPGAVELLAAARAAGLSTLLVSGGFTWFTDRLATVLGIDATRANRLEIVDGRLTGRLAGSAWGPAGSVASAPAGPIVDAAVKHRTLVERCAALGLVPAQAIVCGDGSNDLPMLEAAGLGVAWRAKPIVRRRVGRAIDHCGLDSILGWFGD
ncbi:MAG: phosphoserine phosphatase SerB [Burkholderiaceae bacterium]